MAKRDTWTAAERELARSADAAAEYAQRVLDVHRLAADLTNNLLRGLSDEEVRVREAELHEELRRLLPSLPGVNTVVVLDREAEALLTGNVYPVPRGTRFDDREWVVALREPDSPDLHVSAVTTGRLDNNLFFGVSRRRVETGNRLPAGTYEGLINVSVDPHRLSTGLAAITGLKGDVASLVRADGALLARSSGLPVPPPQIPAVSKLRDAARAGETAGIYMGQKLGPPPDRQAGETRLIAFRRVGDLPLYATVARPTPLIVKSWLETVLLQLAVGLPAWAGLVVLAVLLRRGQRSLALMNAGLELRIEGRTAELRESATRLSTLVDALPLGVGLTDATGRLLVSNAALRRFAPEVAPSRDEARRSRWRGQHSDGRPVQPAEFSVERALRGETVLPGIEMIFTEDDGRETWTRVTAVPLRDDSGQVAGAVVVIADITEQKASEEHQQLLSREVDHRAKNALAVVQAALRLTRKDDAETYAQAIEGRVGALARAHTILAAGKWERAALRELVEAELAAFQPGSAGIGEGAGSEKRVAVDGPNLALAADAVQALSMVLHELATNATKYGALSVPEGRVRVTWQLDSSTASLTITWRESGGPKVAGKPARRGFGSRVIEATVQNQLGGRVRRAWEEDGLVCVMTVPVARAVASSRGTAH
ncbi:HWE histidine kinase domain-containing protein [Falsiroseomonas sp. HW251]|uniref:HWE histidine kinase domain-containing protein n=1 Tax=Falsiroseomonas sp. HW251 TaxID=3390998 RepID=UPI003D310657